MTELQEIEKQNNDSALQNQVLSVGAALEAARLAKGLAQQDVSDSLRYSVRQIDALEKNTFDVLPDAMITRGFIRSYARLLEIDAEPLLLSYNQNVSRQSDNAISVQSSMRPVSLTQESQPWLKYLLASIVVLLFLLAWLFYVDYMPEQPSAELTGSADKPAEAASSVAETSQPLPEIALPAAQGAAEEMTESGSVATPPSGDSANSSASAAAPDISAAASQQVTLNANVEPAKSSDKTVTMAFTAKTWVSVKDKSGKLVYEKMAQNGDYETVTAAPPLSVVIGNVNGIKLQLNGQHVDLTPNTKDNVARITLE